MPKPKKPPKAASIKIRVSQHELGKLQAFAKSRSWTISHTLREYIRRLPNSKSSQEAEPDPWELLRQLNNPSIPKENPEIFADFENFDD